MCFFLIFCCCSCCFNCFFFTFFHPKKDFKLSSNYKYFHTFCFAWYVLFGKIMHQFLQNWTFMPLIISETEIHDKKKKIFFFQIHITENKQSNFNGICWVVVHFWINSGPNFPPQINKKKSTISFNRSTQRYPRKYCMCRNHKKSNDFQLYMNYSNPRSLTSSNFFIF